MNGIKQGMPPYAPATAGEEKMASSKGSASTDSEQRDSYGLRAPQSLAELKSNLKQLRARAGLSQTELGALVGVSVSVVQKWEGASYGRGHPGKYIPRLAEIFRCDPALLEMASDGAGNRQASAADRVWGGHSRSFYLIEKPRSLADYKSNLAYFRAKAGLSQRQLSEKLNTSHARVSAWESTATGTTFNRRRLPEICSILNCRPELISPIRLYGFEPESAAADAGAIKADEVPVRAVAARKDQDAATGRSGFIADRSGGFDLEHLHLSVVTQFHEGSMEYLWQQGYYTGEYGRYTLTYVSGDEMNGGRTPLASGDAVLVDTRQQDIGELAGEIVCIRSGGQTMVRRLDICSGCYAVSSETGGRMPVPLTSEARLVGRITGRISPF